MGVTIAFDQKIHANVFARKIKHGGQTGLVHHQHVAAVGDDFTLELRTDPTRVGL
jgi:hypothetical protein